jgi:hypothetical protein
MHGLGHPYLGGPEFVVVEPLFEEAAGREEIFDHHVSLTCRKGQDGSR